MLSWHGDVSDLMMSRGCVNTDLVMDIAILIRVSWLLIFFGFGDGV